MKLVFRALMIFALLPVLAMAYPAECFQMPTAMPLSDRVEQADLVVVARLSSSKMDPLDPHPHPVPAPIPDGTYGYTVLRVLKGPAVTTVQTRLMSGSRFYYGWKDVNIQDVDCCILTLKLGRQGYYEAVDTCYPIIPIPDEVAARAGSYSGSPMSMVVSMLLDSCDNPAFRKVSAIMLQTVIEPQIVVRLGKYAYDSDRTSRDFVLCCLAVNKDLAAIPAIIDLDNSVWISGVQQPVMCSMLLDGFHDRTALPLLKPGVLGPSQGVRMSVVDPIRNLADTSVLPYAMIMLNDPVSTVNYDGYAIPHEVCPKIGHIDDTDYFAHHKAEEVSETRQWWRLYLKTSKAVPDSADTSRLDYVLTELSTSSPHIRAAGISDAEKLTGDSRIACLMVAMLDPDQRNSYTAFNRLAKLVPGCDSKLTSASFASNPDLAERPIYSWWTAELHGKHLPPSPYRFDVDE